MERSPSQLSQEGKNRLVLWLLLSLAVLVALGLLWWKSLQAGRHVGLVESPATTAPRQAVAPAPETRRPPPARSPASIATIRQDAGPPAVLTLKTIRSLFDLSKLLKRNAAEAAANVERYCAETAKLPKHLFDDPPDAGPLRDAAYFLEPLVTWGRHPPTEGTLQLPQPLSDKVRAAHDDWATVLSASDVAGLDFGWMAQLLDYDYWSLATVGPVVDQAAIVDSFNSPVPNYWTFVDYAKLRYVRALGQGDVAEAMIEVRHLAALLHSNGIVIAEIYAAKLVNLGQPFEVAAARQGYSSMVPQALDSASFDRFHDLTLAGIAFMLPGVDDAVLKRATDCVPDPCVAISEAVAQRRAMERLSEQGDDDAFWSFAGSLACDSALLNLFKGSPSSSLDALTGYLSGDPPPEKLFGPEIAANLDK